MKKNLLLFMFTLSSFVSKTQIILNEKYLDSETIETEAQVKLIYFVGSKEDNKLVLKWNVAENEWANLFVVEKSFDQKNFVTTGLVFGSEKNGNETYFFPDIMKKRKKTFYRLKMINKNHKIKYSRILSVYPSMVSKRNKISVYSNPRLSVVDI
jgi:hypothetical protein